MKQNRIGDLWQKKASGQRITMLTAYDHLMASMVDACGVDMVLVGDSLGNVFSGFKDTLPVTMDAMVYHTQAVSRGCSQALVVADMPFMSYQVSAEQARENAGRLLKEGGAHAVKIEVNHEDVSTIESICQIGVPVMGHLGLTPQSVNQLGGYRVQGRDPESASALLDRAKALEAAGCFAVLLELVPKDLSKEISEALKVPCIGIGAGSFCDGQVLVSQDLLGMTAGTPPKFVKAYADLKSEMSNAISTYIGDVESGRFPEDEHSYD